MSDAVSLFSNGEAGELGSFRLLPWRGLPRPADAAKTPSPPTPGVIPNYVFYAPLLTDVHDVISPVAGETAIELFGMSFGDGWDTLAQEPFTPNPAVTWTGAKLAPPQTAAGHWPYIEYGFELSAVQSGADTGSGSADQYVFSADNPGSHAAVGFRLVGGVLHQLVRLVAGAGAGADVGVYPTPGASHVFKITVHELTVGETRVYRDGTLLASGTVANNYATIAAQGFGTNAGAGKVSGVQSFKMRNAYENYVYLPNPDVGWTVFVIGTFTTSDFNTVATRTANLSDGTLTWVASSSSAFPAANLRLKKTYCEFTVNQRPGDTRSGFGVGITNGGMHNPGIWAFFASDASAVFSGWPTNGYANETTFVTDSAYHFAVGDRIGLAVDAVTTNVTMWISRNGVWINGVPGVSGGLNFDAVSANLFFTASWLLKGGFGTSIEGQMYPNKARQLYPAPAGFTVYDPV